MFRCLSAVFLVAVVAKGFDGVGRALLIGVVVLASAGLVWRDIKRGGVRSGNA
jgi:hypothetical protein